MAHTATYNSNTGMVDVILCFQGGVTHQMSVSVPENGGMSIAKLQGCHYVSLQFAITADGDGFRVQKL